MSAVSPANEHAAAFQKAAQRGAFQDKFWRTVVLIVLFIGALVFLLPFYIMVVMSLKTQSEMATTAIWSWPQRPTFENYVSVLTNEQVSFLSFLNNTTLVAVISTLGVLSSSAVCAYGFARLQFAGRDRLFLILLATMMLPGIVTMIPSYVMFAKAGWVNTFLPLTVPAFFGGGAFNIFLLRQFILTLPREMDEAALLDGATHWTIFSRVIMPLCGPALATVGIFSFTGAWRDFFGPLIYLNEQDKFTLELGLRAYQGFQAERWNLTMAASVLVMIPLVILFFIGQKWFVKSIVMSGIK